MKIFFLLLALSVQVFVPVPGVEAAGIRLPEPVPSYLWDDGCRNRMLVAPSRVWKLVEPFVGDNVLAWRISVGDYPVSGMRAGFLRFLRRRFVEWNLLRKWREVNGDNCLRSSRDGSSLLPTIYLPLDMPPALAGAIGEGGRLDITGHQKITLSGITHYRPNAVHSEGESRSLFPDLKMEQELQVKLQGTIGEKIHVDVDHDSRRSVGPQSSLSLRYEGYEDEVIQSIEMGDVSLSITGPEFVSYSIPSKGLFGAKALAQVGPVEITTIVSREAGSSESAEFVGQATMVEDTILDIYPADNYFFVTLPDTLQQVPLVSIRVFQDDLDGTNNQETGAVEAAWYVEGTSLTGTGWWDELLPGQDLDFVLEDSSRVIRFNSPVDDNYMLAIWAVNAHGDTMGSIPPGGGDWNLKLIKESNPLSEYPTWNYELRNRYFLGADNIVRESFHCDIYLQRSGEDPVPTQDGVPFIRLLGLDTNGDGNLFDEENAVDWDNGFLVFPRTRPFIDPKLKVRNPAIYHDDNPLPVDSKYFIAVSYRAASTTYSLGRMGIIPGSEKVILTEAGQTRTLVRDVDYTIIYEIGLLTLMGDAAQAAQNPDNTLKVTFEYLPLFASQRKTLFGTRAVYGIDSGSWVGITAMFEDASTPGDRPKVGEESTRTFVADMDARLEARPEFLTDAVNFIPGITTESRSRAMVSGEMAFSFPEPNKLGRAYVDDMEGTEISFPLGQSRASWHRPGLPMDVLPATSRPGTVNWFNPYRKWRQGQIIPYATEQESDDWVNNTLTLYFEPDDAAGIFSWGGVQRCIDKYGLDFTDKTHVRLYVRATGAALNGNLYLDLGERMDEDSYWPERTAGRIVLRANGELDTEDLNNDGELSGDEDTGLDGMFSEDEPGYDPVSNPDPDGDDYPSDPEQYHLLNGTERNGNLDTEDLNRNGVLDRSNSFFRIKVPLDDPEYVVTGPNEYGWMLLEIPLNDTALVSVPSIVHGAPTWEKVSYARIWMTGFTRGDTVEVYDLQVVGNRWEPGGVRLAEPVGIPVLPSELFTVSTVDNRNNPEYKNDPPPGVDPGKDEFGEPRLEQSVLLAAENIRGGHLGIAVQNFYNPGDYTGYGELAYLVHGDADVRGEIFYRMGTDSLNYYEVSTPIEKGWKEVTVDLDALVRLKVRKDREGLDYLREGDLVVMGNPNMASVMQLGLGLRNTSAASLDAVVWIDDIVLRRPLGGRGAAHRVSAALDLADFASIEGDYRSMDSEFHGLGKKAGQGYTSTEYSTGTTVRLDRFTPPLWGVYAPLSYSWNMRVSRPVFQSGSDVRLPENESALQQTRDTGWSTGFQLRKDGSSERWPARYFVDPFRFTYLYAANRGGSPMYMDTSSTADGSLSYTLNLRRMELFRLPVLEFFRLRPTSVSWSLGRRNTWDTRWNLADGDTVQTRALVSRTLSSGASLSFNPWKGFNASGSLGLVRDLFYPWKNGMGLQIGREISRNQVVSLSQEVNLFGYLLPRVSFDARYGQSRLAPHTGSGTDSLGLPEFSVTVSRRFNLRIGLVHTIRSLARLRDERLDEDAEPGSPRWFLVRLERWANMINDPVISYSETEGSEYRDMTFIPRWRYRFGLDPTLDDGIPWGRNKGWDLQISGGFRPVSSMSVRMEYKSSDNRSLYSSFWNDTRSRTWPSISVTISGLSRLAGLDKLFRTGSAGVGYSFENIESGRYEEGEYTPTTETGKTDWNPLFNLNVTLYNDVRISVSNNLGKTEMQSFTGTRTRTESRSNSLQLKVQYAFSAPGGIAIPLPILNRLRISFRSDLTTSLSITRNRTVAELFGAYRDGQLQSDREEWRLEPALNYDFGTVTAGLTGIYGWKKDGVNSLYDQRDVGLNVWVMINF